MINTVYANGCSWTAGNGIDEDASFKFDTFVREYAWPSILADLLTAKVVNDGVGAGSNERILRTTCEYLQNIPAEEYASLLVVIGWTTGERQEIFVNDRWVPFNAMQQFSIYADPAFANIANEIDVYQKQYITYVYSNYANYSRYINQKYLLANLLENLKIKYIFTDSLPCTFDDYANLQLAHGTSRMARPAIISDISFINFCINNNYALSSCRHPLIPAHVAWGKYILSRIHDIYGEDL
jgi:hypothetical protein